MKTLLLRPCPNCAAPTLHKTLDPQVGFCVSCWSEQFIGEPLYELEPKVPEEMLKGHLRRERRRLH